MTPRSTLTIEDSDEPTPRIDLQVAPEVAARLEVLGLNVDRAVDAPDPRRPTPREGMRKALDTIGRTTTP